VGSAWAASLANIILCRSNILVCAAATRLCAPDADIVLAVSLLAFRGAAVDADEVLALRRDVQHRAIYPITLVAEDVHLGLAGCETGYRQDVIGLRCEFGNPCVEVPARVDFAIRLELDRGAGGRAQTASAQSEHKCKAFAPRHLKIVHRQESDCLSQVAGRGGGLWPGSDCR
jgi:hypothetical protein